MGSDALPDASKNDDRKQVGGGVKENGGWDELKL